MGHRYMAWPCSDHFVLARQSGNKEASTTAENLIDYLGSRGYLDFRDLLKIGDTGIR